MKKVFILTVVAALTINGHTQSPQKMSYQAVIRNSSGQLVANHAVGMRISILQGSATGTAVYVETQTPTTNANGLATIEIGGGSIISGTFAGINWASGPYYLKTETDPLGGSSYSIVGTSKLLSVPYALHSKSTESYSETDPVFGASPVKGITSSNISNWNTAYGWGNHAGLYKPLSYVPVWSEVTGIPAGFDDGVDNVDDADNSVTNEIQALSIAGSSLSLSKGGGAVTISGDNWGTQVIVPDATLTGNGTSATPLKIAENGVTSAKILDATIVTADLANNSVTSAKIADGTILNTDIADNAIGSSKIQDASVGTTDIAGNAITTAQIANNAVTIAKLPSGAATDKYLRGDGTWATPPTGIITETDPTWSGAANETVATGRTGNVGIGTTSPASLLHTYGIGTGQGNVVFVGQFKEANPGNPPVSGAGTRMMWYPDKAAFRAGKVDETQWDASNIGNYSTAMGYGCKASGICAFATGFYTTASEYMSTAMGYRNTASGQYSTVMGSDANATGYGGTAIGYGALASGMYSTALGVNTIASGDYSTAMGTATTASSYHSTAVGRWNVGGGNRIEWIDTDPLFEIGNGSSYPVVQPHNAMTVLKNGFTGIGTNTPGTYLHILGNSNTQLPQLLLSESEADYARLSFKNTAATTKNWSIAGRPDPTDANSLLNFWYWNGTSGTDVLSIKGNGNVGIGTTNPTYKLDIAGPLNLNKGLTMGALYCNGSQALWFDGTHYSWGYGGGPGTTFNYFANPITIGNAANPAYMLYVQGSAYATGSWSSSDIRFKKDISTIDNALDRIMKIRGTSFLFRKDEFKDYQFAEGIQYGFIAQEVEKVFPGLVHNESDGFKSLNYNGMIPVLLESMKEQQLQIESQQKQIDELKHLVKNLMQK